MPKQHEAWRETWKDNHPDWEFRLWTDRTLPPDLPDGYGHCKTWSEKSDFIRHRVLSDFGGVYIDTDFECLRPIDKLLAGIDYFACSENGRHISVGIVGAVPNHPVSEFINDRLRNHWLDLGDASKNSGPQFVTRVLRSRPDLLQQVHIFPTPYFYPFGFADRLPENYRDKYRSEGSYGVHHWAWSWKPEGTRRPKPRGQRRRRKQ